jgi:DNA processing protein
MSEADDPGRSTSRAALVALARTGRRPPSHYADLIDEGLGPERLLEEEQGLLTAELISAAAADVAAWKARGLSLVTVLDGGYPENLRAVHDRPPFIFVQGELAPTDVRAVAIVGSRQASAAGIGRARAISNELINSGYTIVSGLAVGIDTAAHTVALERGARTLAVIGTGLDHCYPRQNESLQRRIASEGAVISRFWPEEGARRDTFPLRNALMSGLSLATVIVEAGHTSGARIQARHALAHGRPVLLARSLLDQSWASRLAERPGIHVIRTPAEVVEVIARLSSAEAPTR